MRLEGLPNSRRNAKRLRSAMTPPEIALWLALCGNEAGLRFRRRYPAGEYVIDFYGAPAKLAVEVDGEAHERGDRPQHDAIRDTWLQSNGVRVVRYGAKQVLTNLEGAVRHIMAVAVEQRDSLEAHRRPPPSSPTAPPPPGGGG